MEYTFPQNTNQNIRFPSYGLYTLRWGGGLLTMSAPKTGGSLKTSFADMQLKDFIKYVYKDWNSSKIGTFEPYTNQDVPEMVTSDGYIPRDSSAFPNGCYFYFIRVSKNLCIADRDLGTYMDRSTVSKGNIKTVEPFQAGDIILPSSDEYTKGVFNLFGLSGPLYSNQTNLFYLTEVWHWALANGSNRAFNLLRNDNLTVVNLCWVNDQGFAGNWGDTGYISGSGASGFRPGIVTNDVILIDPVKVKYLKKLKKLKQY